MEIPSLVAIIISLTASAAGAASITEVARKVVQAIAERDENSLLARLTQQLGLTELTAEALTQKDEALPYAARFSALAQSLVATTQEADRIIREMTEVVQEQEAKRHRLEQDVQGLAQQEAEVKARLEHMTKEDIVGAMIEQERRHAEERKADATRAQRQFIVGVLLSAFITAFFSLVTVLVAVATHHLGWT